MKGFKNFQLITLLATVLCISSLVTGQINTACTSSMISSFSPCMNYLTGSSANGTSPTTDCCSALKSLMSSSMGCACLIVTASVPLQLPISRTLAISLPKACNMPGVPVQCQASGSPLPAPGPMLFGPSPSPADDSPLSPQASKAVAVSPAPESDLSPAPAQSDLPNTNPGIRPVINPSSSSAASSLPSTLLIYVAVMIFKYL